MTVLFVPQRAGKTSQAKIFWSSLRDDFARKFLAPSKNWRWYQAFFDRRLGFEAPPGRTAPSRAERRAQEPRPEPQRGREKRRAFLQRLRGTMHGI